MMDTTSFALGHDLLSHAQERTLFEQIKCGSADAANKLVEYNQRLVFTWAYRFLLSGRAGDQTIEDLQQWGNMGLFTAIQRFEPERGYKFSTYAVYWIRLFISRYGTKQGFLFQTTYASLVRTSKVMAVITKLEGEKARKPKIKEVAERLGIEPEDVIELVKMAAPPIEIDRPVGPMQTDNLLALLEDDRPGPEEEADEALMQMAVRKAIDQLPERYAEIMRLLFGIGREEMTAANVARMYKLSHTRIQQIRAESLTRLRVIMARQGISKDFL